MKNSSQVKAILFDADGMVLLTDQLFSQRVIKDFEVNEQVVKHFFKTQWNDIIIGKKDLKTTLEPLLSKWKWAKSVEELLDYWFSDGHLDQNIINSIQTLKQQDIICDLATNQEKHRLDYINSKLGFSSLFNHVHSSCNIGHKKPSKEFFDFILNKVLHLIPEEVMFWDDRPENIKAGDSYGLKSFLYQNFADFKRTINDNFNIIV